MKREKTVDKCVDNSVNNLLIIPYTLTFGDIHRFITAIYATFPLFFAEKRYKLIKFAPKIEIVDKLPYWFIIRK